MRLLLERLDEDFLLSPYGPKKSLVPLPGRMRWLHPDAKRRLEGLAKDGLVCTDVYRSPAASLVALKTKRGVQPPGYSAHNYGLAVDLDVKQSMDRLEFVSKEQLDTRMRVAGFECFCKDHLLKSESWHYTFGARGPGSKAVEAVILEHYGKCFVYDNKTAQFYLRELRLYDGALDGKLGPQSRMAIRLFQRQWAISETGTLDAKTRRLLALVTAEN